MGYLESSLKRNSRVFPQESQNIVQENSAVNNADLLSSADQSLYTSNIDNWDIYQPDTETLQQIDPYITSYVCLLAPRFEEHLLSGDLTDQLHIWMNDICISFNWQLKFIEMKPKYLHWIMTVSIAAYPMEFIKTVCQETSKRIFDDFPKFKQKNMSNEFWAPWYFVGAGEAPYSNESIKSFLTQIRMEQGLR